MKFYTTQAIAENMESNPLFKSFVLESVNRHLSGDWGETCIEDAALNNEKGPDNIMTLFETLFLMLSCMVAGYCYKDIIGTK